MRAEGLLLHSSAPCGVSVTVTEAITSFGPIGFGLVATLILWERVVRPEIQRAAQRIDQATQAAERAAVAAERAAESARVAVEHLVRVRKGRNDVR